MTVIPTFDRRTLVCRAIDSALSQTYLPQEVIVVDDGSTDSTGDMLRERYDDRIRYVAQQNGGVSRARNRGMLWRMGTSLRCWTATINGASDKLERQVAFLQASRISAWSSRTCRELIATTSRSTYSEDAM